MRVLSAYIESMNETATAHIHPNENWCFYVQQQNSMGQWWSVEVPTSEAHARRMRTEIEENGGTARVIKVTAEVVA